MVELNDMEDEMTYDGNALNLSIGAVATDADGKSRVSFM